MRALPRALAERTPCAAGQAATSQAGKVGARLPTCLSRHWMVAHKAPCLPCRGDQAPQAAQGRRGQGPHPPRSLPRPAGLQGPAPPGQAPDTGAARRLCGVAASAQPARPVAAGRGEAQRPAAHERPVPAEWWAQANCGQPLKPLRLQVKARYKAILDWYCKSPDGCTSQCWHVFRAYEHGFHSPAAQTQAWSATGSAQPTSCAGTQQPCCCPRCCCAMQSSP